MTEVDKASRFKSHEMIAGNEQTHINVSFDLKDLKIDDQYDIMEIDNRFSKVMKLLIKTEERFLIVTQD